MKIPPPLLRVLASTFRVTALGGLVALAACQDEQHPTAPAPGETEDAISPTNTIINFEKDPVRPAEWRSTELAQRIPGFGGYAFDEHGNIHVYMTAQANRGAIDAVRAALVPFLAEWKPVRDMQRAAVPSIIVEQGQYTFFQLRNWRDRSVDDLLAAAGVTFVDLAESENRLVVGIDPSDARSARIAVERVLAQHRVPLEAVRLEERPAPTYASRNSAAEATTMTSVSAQAACGNLSSECRPLLAGTQIGYHKSWAGPKECTLGFTAYLRGARVFITAAHCSDRVGYIDNDLYGQPNVVTASYQSGYVGWEYVDPYFGGEWDKDPYDCAAYRCRRSDMLVVYADELIGHSFIARTDGYGSTGAYTPGGKQIVGSWRIAGEYGGGPPNYQTLEKVGITTGWTYGWVNGTCIDIRYNAEGNTSDPNYWVVFRCQHYVRDAYAWEGDSGAPVFALTEGLSGPGVTLYGIAIAKTAGSGFYYTSMDMIRLDLGIPVNDPYRDLATR